MASDDRRRSNGGSDRRPGPSVPSEADAPTELKWEFWRLVVVFNVALLATAIGVMLIGFRGQLGTGGASLIGGLALFGVGLYRYRTVRRNA
ncbi:MAG: hypothetical protein SVG88_03275 [Halobacteriales archaeon]|nr:hypothetical protein [Halobacteriales archaeon]